MSRDSGTGGSAPPEVEEVGTEALVAAARSLIVPGRRTLLGIVGAPGSGKSTLGQVLASALGDRAALVGLDGFHLSNAELDRLGRRPRKGAVDTFDAAGYVSLLRRLRAGDEDVVYASLFDRSLEESIACAVPVPREVPLVITEGNYLLVEEGPWGQVRGLLDTCWFLEPGEETRLRRLVSRHMAYGRSAEEAHDRSHGSDQTNAELIGRTGHRADRVLRVVAADGPDHPTEERTA
ncbi:MULTISPECIES: nucleoside/nucleotide kinase family protein [unclassified Streptomyces]|uniref:nucleoside/nucleotide kinase family protein n=1 Tax=unclassified Streptomyces TaxID=2593676 RepID=UPI002236FC35|nr:nucleoside/nucleotide kinase family protein [Streptomyces sp. SHP 1-2]MCW5251812.1 nucleoside/nucleotide kinase family protein [Streptomyces sp. SHP 1-2]